MEESTFNRMLDEIYGAFGRARPTCQMPAYKSILRRVNDERNIPNEAAKFIAYAICERDSLPLNLGKAVVEEFLNWLDKNPQLKTAAASCQSCSSGLSGWFWAWDSNNMRKVCKCSCNIDEKFGHIQVWTKKMAQSAGYSLNEPVQNCEPVKNEFTQAIGKPEMVRKEHTRQLEIEAGQW